MHCSMILCHGCLKMFCLCECDVHDAFALGMIFCVCILGLDDGNVFDVAIMIVVMAMKCS